jgi:hypothetical protein
VLNVLLEPQVEHLVSLVQHCEPQRAEVEVASFHVIFDAACRANKNVDSFTELRCLAVDVDTAINSQYVVLLWVVFQLVKLFSNLQRQFSGWR